MDSQRGLHNKSEVRSWGSSSIDYESSLYGLGKQMGNTGEKQSQKGKEDQKYF